jgi:outer membrane autotransporter protein
MFGNSGRHQACVPLEIRAKRARPRTSKGAVAAIAFVFSLLAASGANAQQTCSNAFFTFPGASVFSAGALGGAPASVSSIIGSTITTASTAFLLQSTAFIGSPGNPSPYQQGGGIWVRGVGGEVDVKSSSNSAIALNTPANNGTVSCTQKVHENFAGVQLGSDISRLNINGWNIHWGTTAGYLDTRANVVGGATVATEANPITLSGLPPNFVGGGQFNAATQVPFVGTYAAATKGGFFVDGLLRAEYYQNNLNAPGINLFNQNINAHGWSFSSSVGYQWQVPNSKWFFEPSAGVIISRVKVDPFNFVTAGVPGATQFSGSLQVDDIKSDIARFGVRVGTTINSGNLILQPFASVSFWHEFGPDVTSTYATCNAKTGGPGCDFVGGIPGTFSAATTTSTFGTFGQYSLGFSAAVADTGWLAFARVDYRNGPNLEGLSGTGGIRYQFTPDKSRTVTKDRVPVVEVVNWTGFYVGGFGSALLGTADWGYVGGVVSPRVGGYDFGGGVGYDYQVGAWVFGVEADLGKTNLNGSTVCGPLLSGSATIPATNAAPMFQLTCNAWANWLATATARVGYAWERVLLYVKGGGAWTNEQVSATCNLGPLNSNPNQFSQQCTNPAGVLTNGFAGSVGTRGGWTVGYGTEFALTRNWSAKAEYNYTSFGDRNVIATDGSVLNIGMHVSEAKIGLNYRFDSGVVYK